MDKFNRNGAFNCSICHKLTRETGHGEGELQLCKRCLFECYVENAASDYGVGSEQHKQAVANLAALNPTTRSHTMTKTATTKQAKQSNEHNFRVILRGNKGKKRVRHVFTTKAADEGAAMLAAQGKIEAVIKKEKLSNEYTQVLPPLVAQH